METNLSPTYTVWPTRPAAAAGATLPLPSTEENRERLPSHLPTLPGQHLLLLLLLLPPPSRRRRHRKRLPSHLPTLPVQHLLLIHVASHVTSSLSCECTCIVMVSVMNNKLLNLSWLVNFLFNQYLPCVKDYLTQDLDECDKPSVYHSLITFRRNISMNKTIQ